MERDKFPPNHLFYNPSVDETGEFIYLRNTEIRPNHEYNHFILYHQPTQELRKVSIPDGFLLPTFNAYRGIEDVRIVKHNGRLWFTATSTHATNDMRNTVLLGFLDNKNTKVEYITVLSNFEPPTKNINPYVYDGDLYLLDAYGMRLYKVTKIAMTTLQLLGRTLDVHLAFQTLDFVGLHLRFTFTAIPGDTSFMM